MPGVSAAAIKLRQRMVSDGGTISIEGARELLEAEGLSVRDVGFGLIHGQAKARRWWVKSEDGESLELTEKGLETRLPAVQVSLMRDTPPEIPALSSGEEWVKGTAVQLGIPEKLAGSVAAYSNNFDMGNPNQVWAMLSAIPEVPVSARKRLFTTLCNQQGIEPGQELARMVSSLGPDGAPAPAVSPARSPRRYLAMSGEVSVLDEEDENAMSFAQAVQVANLQLEKMKVVQAPAKEPEGLSALDKLLPGLAGRISELLFPASHEGPGVPVNIGGAAVTLSETGFLEYMSLQQKQGAVGLAREGLGKLLEVAQDLAAATDSAYEKFQGQDSDSEPQASSEINAECVSCHRRFHAPPNTGVFSCAQCGTVQDLTSGQVFQDQEGQADQGQNLDPQPPMETCRNCSEQFQMVGRSLRCPNCQYDPMLAAAH